MFVADPDTKQPKQLVPLMSAGAQWEGGLELFEDTPLDPIEVHAIPAHHQLHQKMQKALWGCYVGDPVTTWETLGEFDGRVEHWLNHPNEKTQVSGDQADAFRSYAETLWFVGLEVCPLAEIEVLVHEFPLMNEFMDEFNERFQAENPGVAVGMTVVPAGDLEEVTGQLLAEGSVDVVDIFGFANAAQEYMSGVEPQPWQTLIDEGLLLDLTGEEFVDNYDPASIVDACSYAGGIYCVNLGRVIYSGMFVNTTLLTDVGILSAPTTWEELVTACDTITGAGDVCMTVGGANWWPVFVGSYGILGSFYPDQAALVEGLWDGSIRWDDDHSAEMFRRFQVYASEMLEPQAAELGHDEAPRRFAEGDVAFMPTGIWQGPLLEGAEPDFDWTYVPFPGSSDAAENQLMFGKYDQGWAIAADSPNQEIALAYVAAFSDPANYQAYVDAVGFVPTQPTATLHSQLGAIIEPYVADMRLGFEQHWVHPNCAGEFANGSQAASWFEPFGEWTDHEALAARAQADLDACGPYFRVNAEADYIEGWGFAGSSVTIEVIGVGEPFPITASVYAPDWDPESRYFDLWIGEEFGFDLLPGHVVTVTDGEDTKTLLIEELTFDLFDHESDTLAGTADPFATVRVNGGNEFEGFEEFVDADEFGNWSIDLHAAIGFDLTDDMGGEASINDADGDATFAWPPEPPQEPQIRVSPRYDHVEGFGFESGTEVTITITEGSSTLLTTTAPVEPAEWDGNATYWWISTEGDPDILPGQVVTATSWDGGIVRTLEVQHLEFLTFDVDADVVAGEATAGAEVWVNGGNEADGFERSAVADGEGSWLIDLSPFDLTPDMGAEAVIPDEDGDVTVAWPPHPPSFSVVVNEDHVDGWGFEADSSASITVSTGSDTFVTSGTIIHGELHVDLSFDVEPGHIVTVTGDDSGATKELLVVPLTFDSMDFGSDVLSGTADPGATVRINYGVHDEGYEAGATADGVGDWTVDLSGSFDVSPDTWAEAAIDDEDGDSTVARPPEWASFIVNEAHDFIHGSGFGVGVLVSFAIKDGATAVHSGTTTTDEEGNFGIGVEFDIEPGHIVTVAGPEDTKDLVVDLLRFEDYDPEADVAAGTATSGAVISVYGENEAGWFSVDVVADGSGAWEVSGDEVDFWVDGWTHVGIRDVDGDSTLDWEPAPATIQVDPTTDSVVGQEFEAGTTVTIEIDRGGLVYSGTAIVETGPWGGWTGFGVDLTFDILPGDRVTVTGTTAVKAVVVEALTFDEYDPSLNTAAGTAPADTWLSVFGDGPLGGFELEVLADSGGNWSASGADFPADGEGWMVVAIFDEDGDSTAVQPPYPER
jgi:raffinose/stachyose/melibiose transport system substrate-binding protein